MRRYVATLVCALSAASFACGSSSEEAEEETVTKTRADLLDPEMCKECHPKHYEEWSGSMHAYASTDPVFLAMNARGQKEAGLGDFCVNCHAPMAVREGATTDGLNLADVPKHLQGVTCYFCHNVAEVQGDHNAKLRLANDLTMRGGVRNPVKTGGAHRSAYSPLMDRHAPESSNACGACHDIVTPANVHLERTFAEWKATIFGRVGKPTFKSCAHCHMRGIPGAVIADVPGVPARALRHMHNFPGVDLALTPFPQQEELRAQQEEQRKAVQRFLDTTLRAEVCVAQIAGSFMVRVLLDNVGAGHHFPSGAAQDRRVWIELVAYQGTTAVYESGIVADGEPVSSIDDPDLWQLRDGAFKANGEEAHMFWDVARTDNDCASGELGCMIPGQEGLFFEPGGQSSHVTRRYPLESLIAGTPDRVTLRVRLRPVGLDVLDDLIQSGDLDPAARSAMQTLDLIPSRASTDFMIEWTPELAADPKLGGFGQTIQDMQHGNLAAECVSNAAD